MSRKTEVIKENDQSKLLWSYVSVAIHHNRFPPIITRTEQLINYKIQLLKTRENKSFILIVYLFDVLNISVSKIKWMLSIQYVIQPRKALTISSLLWLGKLIGKIHVCYVWLPEVFTEHLNVERHCRKITTRRKVCDKIFCCEFRNNN